MTSEQYKLCKIVLEDLDLLEEDFGGDNFQDSRIRNASSIMNKLFNEGNLIRAWKAAISPISQPFIHGPRLEYFSNIDVNKNIINAVAGGAVLGGIVHAIGMTNKGNKAFPSPPNVNPIEHKFSFKKYFESAGLILSSHKISRFMIIKYVANKAGGKHIDFRLNDKKDFVHLENGKDAFNYFGKNALYIELHSIIQLVLKSKDIIKLREVIRRL
jgi:hypothetical protein